MDFDYCYINALGSLLGVCARLCVVVMTSERAHLHFTLDLDRYLHMHTNTSSIITMIIFMNIISYLYCTIIFHYIHLAKC